MRFGFSIWWGGNLDELGVFIVVGVLRLSLNIICIDVFCWKLIFIVLRLRVVGLWGMF